ncbi:MAG: hypothetical protein L3J20_06515 [Flavobacteriaceae bacterium]|nr:hypothetical protein [Flavobacteriaceae bacterium]
MPYNIEEKKLTIDLSKENYEPKMLLEHKDVAFIRISKCVEQFELPVALKGYKALAELYILGKSQDVLYPPPLHLEKLINIKKLNLSYCDLEKLEPMPHIEILKIIIKKPYDSVQVISSIFPNLKKLELSGAHLRLSGELPPEIGSFKNLEHLELVSCGLTNLPPEFKKLKNLKSLKMIDLAMRIFPEVLCELDKLEELTFSQNIVSLPDNFSNLKALKKLDFYWAFNNGTTSPVNMWSDKSINLHSIPEVIGKLPSLQELDLSCCGVVSLAFLKPLKTLKKLRLKHSGLENCNELSHLHSLEELSLEKAKALTDIKGLTGLPIKKLNLDECEGLKSINPIKDLQVLEELRIELCNSIRDFDAIYQHPNLKVLKASKVLMKQWSSKELFKNIPSLNTVITDLSSEDVTIVEKAMNNLGLHADKNYQSIYGDYNHFSIFFEIDAGEGGIIDLPILDTAFLKHKDKLTIDTVINLIKTSFKTVGYDNYTITMLAIDEIISRKDVNAQKQVIAQFDKACEASDYSYRYRYNGNTVHDQLLDNFFGQFEVAALIDLIHLITDPYSQMLNCDGGDEGDHLFIPAFKKCANDADFNLLLTTFFKYQDESIEYHEPQHFTDLHNKILAVLNEDYHIKFADEMKKRDSQTRLYTLLDSNNPKNIEQLIEVLDKEENKKFTEANNYKILQKINQQELPLDYVTTALDFFIKKKELPYYVEDTLRKYMFPNGKETVIAYLKTKEDSENKKYIGEIISRFINAFNTKNASMEDIQPFRAYLKELANYNDDTVYAIEIQALLEMILSARFHGDDFYKMLSRFEEIISLVVSPPISVDLDRQFNLYLLLKIGETEKWDIVKRLCCALFTVIPLKDTVRALYISVVSSIMTEDYDFLKFLKQYIPVTTEDNSLVYYLACAFSMFSEKETMLKYIRRSLELNETKATFLDDPNFAKYWEDNDFLKALEHTI